VKTRNPLGSYPSGVQQGRRIICALGQSSLGYRDDPLSSRSKHSRLGFRRRDLFMSEQIGDQVPAQGSAMRTVAAQSSTMYSMSHR
jgi:hypothetical protein